MSHQYIKGTIKTIVLKLLAENHRMYGYEINQKVKTLSKGEIELTYGALYPILYKLESDGLLTTRSEIVENRARKYYSLTKKGKVVAREKVSELRLFTEVLNHLLQPDPKGKLSLELWGN